MLGQRVIALVAGRLREMASVITRETDEARVVSTRADGVIDESLTMAPIRRVPAGVSFVVPADRILLVTQLGLVGEGDIVVAGDLVEIP